MTGQSRMPAIWQALRHPRRHLREFDAARPALSQLPFAVWTWLVLIAVAGSLIYGASLGVALPDWRPGQGALWLTFSAGLGWCIFGPVLALLTRRSAFTLAHACLVTMAYGEIVLTVGAAINVVLAVAGNAPTDLTLFNTALIGVSNVVMAAALTIQLAAIRVPIWKTLLCWVVVLNGSGVLFFWGFARLLRGV